MTDDLNPQRVVDDLRELQHLTGDEHGAQRVAWTDTWDRSRQWLREKLSGLPVEIETDEAGNMWATLRGKNPQALLVGSHIDSVVNGGWLDGCLGVVAGLEVLRCLAAGGQPDVTVRLVSWADEEGGHFGRSLFGSSAAAGNIDPQELKSFRDQEGRRMPDVLSAYGVDLDTARQAGRQLGDAAACLELHIEQGPVLESLGLTLGAVTGALGVERHIVRFIGQTAHSGSTPIHLRRDALAAASRFQLEARDIACRRGGLGTVGGMFTRPGIVTAIVGDCECYLDQRHLDSVELAAMLSEAREASERIAREERVEVEWRRLYHIDPTFFHPDLVNLCAESIVEAGAEGYRMPSGPLHDAVEMARAGIPTAMLFVQSLNGLSHTREEDTREEHLRLAVRAFYSLVLKTTAWIRRG